AQELLADCGYEERADIAEVLRAIDEEFNFSASELEIVRRAKADKRGEFRNKVFLEYVDEH
ncbi:phosphoribosyl-ATP pyrophosphohydrolase, partial [Microbacteriaceae bacterium]|nr:phosphoribosyl-ATP pyrophosphohydrolase [Candidatus Saccharibacteria bacterium]